MPDFRGMAPARAAARRLGTWSGVRRSDHFYSATIPAGRIVYVSSPTRTLVPRSGWRVQAPKASASGVLRSRSHRHESRAESNRLFAAVGLELETSAELPTGDAVPQAILAQTPSPGAQGVASPRVSLLVAAPQPEPAYVMPDLSA